MLDHAVGEQEKYSVTMYLVEISTRKTADGQVNQDANAVLCESLTCCGSERDLMTSGCLLFDPTHPGRGRPTRLRGSLMDISDVDPKLCNMHTTLSRSTCFQHVCVPVTWRQGMYYPSEIPFCGSPMLQIHHCNRRRATGLGWARHLHVEEPGFPLDVPEAMFPASDAISTTSARQALVKTSDN
ncbi:hypothetical protein VTO42DRAFT_4164 [Malbranchea cinnamomea]